MTNPADLARNVARMDAMVDALEESTLGLVDLVQTAAEQRHEWEVAEAKNLLLARFEDGLKSAELRKAWVLAQPGMAALHLAYLTSDAVAKASGTRIGAMKAEADLLRSINRGAQDLAVDFHGERRG